MTETFKHLYIYKFLNCLCTYITMFIRFNVYMYILKNVQTFKAAYNAPFEALLITGTLVSVTFIKQM